MPVMCLDDVRNVAADRALADRGGHLGERGEAHAVVRPLASRAAVGIARPRIEMRRVEHQQVEPRRAAGQHMCRSAVQLRERMHRRRILHCRHHRGITGQQCAHRDAFDGERAGQRTDDVGEPAGLDKRKRLRGNRQDA